MFEQDFCINDEGYNSVKNRKTDFFQYIKIIHY